MNSVLIDDARTPLIISGPTPRGEQQDFDKYKPIVEKLYNAQRQLVTNLLSEARRLLNDSTNPKMKKKEQNYYCVHIEECLKTRHLLRCWRTRHEAIAFKNGKFLYGRTK